MSAPKTTRMRAHFCAGALAYFDDEGETPVLVVPEAAGKDCEHKRATTWGWCPACGADYSEEKRRWQRPRILRVGR